ncbi:MAG: polysaccharide deacetylase family protein [Sphingobacteriaceae bacterium]|nr:polysaccharide deacetylase family protein [Sphingobacteriaceae bacterium]
MNFVKAPLLLKWLYPNLTWKGAKGYKTIYLTFDDGPIPEITDFVLEQLKTYDSKATFFCIGDNIKKYPAIFENIKKEGHSIGNHTFNHLNGWQTNNKTYFENFNLCQNLMQSNLFRPPYGKIKRKQIKDLRNHHPNLKIVMWDVLSLDFIKNQSPEDCYQNVIKHAQDGSIVVFHDSVKSAEKIKYALPKVLSYFSKQGYQFKSL